MFRKFLFILLISTMLITACATTFAAIQYPAAEPGRQSATRPIPAPNAQRTPSTAPRSAENAGSASSVGTNLNAVTYWSSEFPFVDLFKSASTWIPQCNAGVDPGCTGDNAWDTGEYDQIDLDDNGWPRALPANGSTYTFVSALLPAAGPLFGDGRYIVLYDGQGTLSYGWGAVKDEASSAPGRDVIDLSTEGGNILISIIATDPNHNGDYLRNIRVIPAAYENTYQTQPFTPLFLDKIGSYQLLRFMDWMGTNGSRQRSWATRPRPAYATYATDSGVDGDFTNPRIDAGAPVEVLVDLANQTQKDPWFNTPHLADDDYITQFATLVRDRLDPNLKVYVEYSNETWNGMFDQHDYVMQQGDAAFGGDDSFQNGLNWHGKRTAEMCDIWKGAFGDQSERVVCVMGSWGDAWAAEETLACPLWTDGAPCSKHGVDALAIAPYFGYYIGLPENESTLESWTHDSDGGLGKLFTEITEGGQLHGPETPANGALEGAFGVMSAAKGVADAYGVQLVAYEGGQHLAGVGDVANSDAITTLFTAANRDPRMGAVYTRYLDGWKAHGGGLFVNYSLVSAYDKWGSWGALESIDQETSPKWEALQNYMGSAGCQGNSCAHAVFLPHVAAQSSQR